MLKRQIIHFLYNIKRFSVLKNYSQFTEDLAADFLPIIGRGVVRPRHAFTMPKIQRTKNIIPIIVDIIPKTATMKNPTANTICIYSSIY